jgi:hypothetical protein
MEVNGYTIGPGADLAGANLERANLAGPIWGRYVSSRYHSVDRHFGERLIVILAGDKRTNDYD